MVSEVVARAVERPCTVQRELEYQFATQAASVDVAQQSTNYLRYYTEHIEAKLKGGSVCSSEVVFYRDGWRQDIDICAIAGDNGYTNCAGACLSHEVQGPPASAARCTFTAAGARARQMSVSSTVYGRAVSRLLSFTVWSRFDSGLYSGRMSVRRITLATPFTVS